MKIRLFLIYIMFCGIGLAQNVVAAVDILFDVPIVWEKKKNSASVQAVINGISGKFIIDTGSYPTIFSEQFVQKLRVKYPKPLTRPKTIESSVKVKMGTLTVNISQFGVIPTANSPLRENEFATGKYAGLFNPFFIKMGKPNRMMVIDFPRDQLYGLEGSKEEREAYFRQYYTDYPLHFEVPYRPRGSFERIMIGNVEGRKTGNIIFDTGANNTSFTASYMHGEKVAKYSKVMNMKGEVTRTPESFPKKIYLLGQLLGEVSVTMDAFKAFVNNGPKDVEKYIGAIGLDLLQHCAIVSEDAEEKMTLFCKTPPKS